MYKIDELIEKANNLHNNKYKYDISTYTKMSEKMTIICPIHGEFRQSLHEHINKKYGCPKCGIEKRVNERKYDTKSFIEKAKEIHGDKYDYSKVEYKNSLTQITIICPIHGEFNQRPDCHLQGKGCPICHNGRKKERTFNKKMSFSDFVNKCYEKFDHKYEYYDIGYKNLSSKVKIVCPIHGEYEQIAISHINSKIGCPKCSYNIDSIRKYSNTKDFIKKAKEIHGDKYDYSKVDYNGSTEYVDIICPIHGIFQQTPYNHLSGKGCKNCVSYLNEEEELYNYICSIYNGEIKRHDRTILNGQEIDIFIPDKNIAFEFDGLYWHCELKKDSKYHLNKTDQCLTKGVRLIHIFEDEWNNKKEICKSRIKNILGLTTNIIYARKCVIKYVDSKISNKFLENNHIQSSAKSNVNIGLYYNDELVSIMTFSKLRKNLGYKSAENEYELLRFCNKLDYSVIGGASKLFSFFIKEYNPNRVISYADRRWSTGNLYEKLNFSLSHKSQPSYFYIINNKRYNRFGFRKDVLIKKYGCTKEETEHSFCLKNKWYRIYDCGTLVFNYFKNN